MSDPYRVRRQQILREAEGYLELISLYQDRWPCSPAIRDSLGNRSLETLKRIENPGGLKAQILFLEGQALRIMERFNEAAIPLHEAAELEPQNIHVRLALAWCYKRSKRLDLAIETLEEALDAEPTLAIVHYNLACYWSLAGNAKLAVSFLAQAFEMQPNYRDHILAEHDFDPIRNHPYFLALTAVIV